MRRLINAEDWQGERYLLGQLVHHKIVACFTAYATAAFEIQSSACR
jgi:hypothetical protein